MSRKGCRKRTAPAQPRVVSFQEILRQTLEEHLSIEEPFFYALSPMERAYAKARTLLKNGWRVIE